MGEELLSYSNTVFDLQGAGISGVPPSGGGFSPGQNQVSTQDQEKVSVTLCHCCIFISQDDESVKNISV